MTDEEIEQTTQQAEIQKRYHASLVNELKRLNADYVHLEKQSIDTLETLKKMELEKLSKRSNEQKPAPSFKSLKEPQKAENKDTKQVQNSHEVERKFNRLQVFHPQYAPVETMAKYNENCTIFSMMVNPDPRFPEWQVS